MPPGPPPKPVEQKRAMGNPGHRRLPKLSVTIPLTRIDPKPPRGLCLGSAGRRLWVAVADLPWVAASDGPSLELMCRTADLLAEMEEDIGEHGAQYTWRGRTYSHPLLGRVNAAHAQLWAQLAAFGLSPADRARFGIVDVRARHEGTADTRGLT